MPLPAANNLPFVAAVMILLTAVATFKPELFAQLLP